MKWKDDEIENVGYFTIPKERKKRNNTIFLLSGVIIALMILEIVLLSGCESNLAWADEIDWDKLVSAVIQVESGGNPNAVSPKGAIGLMQITPIVLSEFNQYRSEIGEKHEFQDPILNVWTSNYYVKVEGVYRLLPFFIVELYQPEINKFVGIWYLHRLFDHYGCKTIEQILAGYNGGPTRLRKCNYDVSLMSYETREYVKKVLKIYQEKK